DSHYTVTVDGRPLEVDLHEAGGDFLSLLIDGRSYDVGLERRPHGYTVVLENDVIGVDLVASAPGGGAAQRKASSGPIRITAPMPGKLVRVLVAPGQEVAAGQGLLVVEAMKMENELRAPGPGRVKDVPAREGQAVETGALLLLLE